MAQGKKNVIVYTDWINTFELLSDEEAGRLIKHFFRYVNDLNPEPPDRMIEILFEPFKSTLKRDLQKWEIRAERARQNGFKGGRPKDEEKPQEEENPTKPSGLQKNPEEPSGLFFTEKKPVSVSVSVSDSVSVSVSDINTFPSKEEKVIHTQKRFFIPSILEISTYCQERKNEINAEQFYDHYQSNGWMVGKNKMKDWKAAVRTWEKNGYSKPQQSNNNQISTQNGTPKQQPHAFIRKTLRNLERLGTFNSRQVEIAEYYLEHATGPINSEEFFGKLEQLDWSSPAFYPENIGDTLRLGERQDNRPTFELDN
jgi:hypothetical protein